MDFKGIFQVLIDNYGIYGLLVAICLVGVCVAIPVILNKHNQKMSENFNKLGIDLSNALKDQNNTLIDKLSETQDKLLESNLNIVNSLIDQKNKIHGSGLNLRDKVSVPIQNKVNHLKDLYRANRVGVIEFHNSLVNLNGLPFLWYDLIYESIMKGTPSISIETKNMPFNILTPIILSVQNGKPKIFNHHDVEKFYDQSSVLYDFCERYDVNDLIVCPLLNSDNELIGLLSLEYSKKYPMNLELIDLEDIEDESKIISALLELNKENNQEEKK